MNMENGSHGIRGEAAQPKKEEPADRSDTTLWQDKPKPFLEHLDEFRSTLIRCLAVFAVCTAAVIPMAPLLFRLIRAPLSSITEHPELFLRSIEITGGFSILMQIALWTGLLVSAPLLFFFAARFIFPGLTRKERKALLIGMVSASALFVLGVSLGYFIALPLALQVMFRIHDWLSIRVEWTINSYIAFSMRLLFAFGLAFELPAVIMALGYMGLVSSEFLRSKRRHAVLIILIISALLTPSDVLSQLAMGIPMILLYEICIHVIRAIERRDA